MRGTIWKRLTALILTAAMTFEFTSPAMALVDVDEESGTVSVTGSDGTVDTRETADWEEAYPYGAFAFKETQINLKEDDENGGAKGSLTVYRLGGTEGRAVAHIALHPAAALVEEDRVSYANAAGANDYKVSVEEPWKIAQYQPLGGQKAAVGASGATIDLTRVSPAQTGDAATQTDGDATTQTGGDATTQNGDATTQNGDATTQNGDDNATTQTDGDAATQTGDATTQNGGDATTQNGDDNVTTQNGDDNATTQTGGDATTQNVDDNVTTQNGGDATQGDDDQRTAVLQLQAEDAAGGYQWQIRLADGGEWQDIDGATSARLVVVPEILSLIGDDGGLDAYDFRCFYDDAAGERWCSVSLNSEAYVSDAPGYQVPEDFDWSTNKDLSYKEIVFPEGDEYLVQEITVTFAEGEYEKEIVFEALSDDLSECTEIVNAIIESAEGAEIYSTASTASVLIEDDDPEIPSTIGFDAAEIWADRSEGKVSIKLTRESEGGLHYVVGASYLTENGTASAGSDFAAVSADSGKAATFASDLDYTYIEIELVDNGIYEERSMDNPYFTVKLESAMGGGLNPSTLKEDSKTIRVYLYNSTEGTGGNNLATALYDPNEVDMTGSAQYADPIVSAGGTVTAEGVDPGENAVATYISTARSYSYPDTVFFGRAHGGDFWTDNAALAMEDVSSFNDRLTPSSSSELDDKEGFIANAASLWKNPSDGKARGSRLNETGWRYSTQRGGDMSMTIENLYHRYSQVTINTRSRVEKSGFGATYNDWSTPVFTAQGDSYYQTLNNNPGSKSYSWWGVRQDTLNGVDDLLFKQIYRPQGIAGDATCEIQLHYGYLTRRQIQLPKLRIHTADDTYIQQDAAALHEAIKPVVALVAGKGGTVSSGMALYNNSQVTVQRADSASAYQFATTSNGRLSNNSLFFGSGYENGHKYDTASSAVTSSSSGSLTLLAPGNKTGTRDQGCINVVMDRVQDFTLDISPSVPKQDGTNTVDQSQISAAWNALWASTSKITYTWREVNWDFKNGNKDGFSDEKTTDLTRGSFQTLGNGAYRAVNLKNVRSINFNLPEEDLILINGKAYAGNEDIPINANQFLNDNLTFYYYDSEYKTGQNTMVATIARVERYIDLNDDGKVEGKINSQTGAFVPASSEIAYSESETANNNGATYYVLPSLTEENYPISELAPRPDANGKYHQIVLKVYYTMLPRSLVLPAGASSADKAEIIPALVTSVTSPSVRRSMTAEQLGYRYIDHNDTGANKAMYFAEASALSFVDIPMGGDFNPATIEGESIKWEPDWRGDPYPGTSFDDPEPIYLDGTVLGDRYPVGEVSGDVKNLETFGKLTETGKAKVNAYLSSIHENDTFALCVREMPETSGTAAAMASLRFNPTTTTDPDGGGETGTEDETGSGGTSNAPTDVESSQTSGQSTYPDPDGARETNDPTPEEEKGEDFDSSDAGSPLPEFNMSGGINLPEFDIGVSDFVHITTNGLEVGITLGGNLFGMGDFESKDFNDSEFKKPTFNGTSASNEESIENAKNFINGLRSGGKSISDTIKERKKELWEAKDNATSPTLRTASLEAQVGSSLTILLKYDPIENRYFLNQLMVAVAGEIKFSYTMRLTACPIFYLCLSASVGAEMALGLEAVRVKVVGDTALEPQSSSFTGATGNWVYYEDQKFMGYTTLDEPENEDFVAGAPGSSFTITTQNKAVDIYFCGKLYVEAVGDAPEGFKAGTIQSAGDEAVTIKLANKVDGKQFDQSYTLKFTVVDDGRSYSYTDYSSSTDGTTQKLEKGWALVDRVVTIEKQTSDVHFAGVNISPELTLEVAIGVDLIVAKVELFVNVSVGCSFALAPYEPPVYEGDEAGVQAFYFNEFSLAISLGLRAQFLMFSFEFNIVQFTVTYDRETRFDEDTNKKTGWNVTWYVANQPVRSYARSLPGAGGSSDALAVTVVLPGETARNETLHGVEDNAAEKSGISLFAFRPTYDDGRDFPFEYSDFSSSGNAFELGGELTPGSTYELVTVGNDNYIVYTVTVGADSGINQSRLVLSKVVETQPQESSEEAAPLTPADQQFLDDLYPDDEPVSPQTDDPSDDQNTGATGQAPDDVGLQHPTNADSPTVYMMLDDDDDEYGDLDFDVWVDDNNNIHVAWVSYTDAAADAYKTALGSALNPTTADTINAMEAAAKNTVVKTVTVDVSSGTGKGDVKTVSANETDHGAYFMPTGAGDMVFYAEANHYGPEALSAWVSAYEDYLGVGDIDQKQSGSYYYGTGDPTVNYQMAILQTRAQVYGQSFKAHFAAPDKSGTYVTGTVPHALDANAAATANKQLENSGLAKIGDTYYAVYSTAESELVTNDAGTSEETTDQRTIRKLYVQKVTVEEETVTPPADEGGEPTTTPTTPTTETVVKPGDLAAVTKLIDFSKDSSEDGVYVQSTKTTDYQDPYFANIQFLTGKLGNLSPGTEGVQPGDAPETFLLYEMNGNTYVVPKSELAKIGTESGYTIYPFFNRTTAQNSGTTEANEEEMPAVTAVTFGVDGNGNVAAVYTRASGSVPGNAVYLTKYDPESNSWGMGTRLAMQNLSVVEKAEANDWTTEELVTAYYDTSGDGKADTKDSPTSFTFNRLRVGMTGEDRLLILAEGTSMQLEATPQMKAVTQVNEGPEENRIEVTGIEEATDEEGNTIYTFQPVKTAGSYAATNGIYALSFGAGQAGIGTPALHLSNHNFTAGASMSASVSFVNNGDVPIRGSATQPAEITLWAGNEKLYTWEITELVKAGQEVATESAVVTMPNDLKTGDKIYFTVNDGDASGGFSATTKTDDEEEDTAACITVADNAELGYESFEITMLSADEDTVTLSADIHVGNRGSAASPATYLRFLYETGETDKDGNAIWKPVDLSGHNLSVSEERPLRTFSLFSVSPQERTLQNGYLLLRTTENGAEVDDTHPGRIQSMYGRTVTGTFTVPKSYYNTESGSGSLNLQVVIESYESTTSDAATAEYYSGNNLRHCSVEQKTLFDTVPNVQMQVGSTLRLPLTMQTSTESAPSVSVVEMTDDNVRRLSVLYHDANQGSVVVMAAREGDGKIRIMDTATNSFYDICYNIEGEGVETNIFNDNGIFSWNSPAGSTVDQAWDFEDNALVWSNDLNEAPLRNDLAIAQEGASFTFQTFADSIDLYFMGASQSDEAVVTVHSNLGGFTDQTLRSTNGETMQTVKFNNEESVAHTVTITVDKGPVSFDRLLEHFSDSLQIQTDSLSPGVFYSRTLPAQLSIKPSADSTPSVPLTVYFADLSGLSTVIMNNVNVTDRLNKDGDELWSLDLNITQNGSYRFIVQDTMGNITTRDLTVDWFAADATDVTNEDPGAPALDVQLTDQNGAPITGAVSSSASSGLKVTAGTGGNAISSDVSFGRFQYDDAQSPQAQSFSPISLTESGSGSGWYSVSAGIYSVAVTNDDGVTSYRYVNLRQDAQEPAVSLQVSGDGNSLQYSAEKPASKEGSLAPITELTLNGFDLISGADDAYRFAGSVPLNHGGTYVLSATDTAARTTKTTLEVLSKTVALPEAAIKVTKVTEQSSTSEETGETVYTSNSDGVVEFDLAEVTGGRFDEELTKKATEQSGSFTTVARYQFALVKAAADGESDPVPAEDDWQAGTSFTDLDVGTYLLYIRDANDHTNVSAAITVEVGLKRVIIQSVETTLAPDASITVTATGGVGELEYAIYSTTQVASGEVVINDHNTPDDDSDDTVDTVGGSVSASRPLWQSENTLTGLPAGTYLVQVRDKTDPGNIATQTVTVRRPYTGSDTVYYPPILKETENGTVTFSPAQPAAGELVTIRPVPDEGYEVGEVSVTDALGNAVALNANSDGTWAFRQPGGRVTIAVTFRKTGLAADCPRDESCPMSAFGDVNLNAWYHDGIHYCVEHGLMVGTGDAAFEPETTTSRAMIATILWRLEGSPAVAGGSFSDVADGLWYTDAVAWAASVGVVNGYGDGTFGPNDSITREQLAAMLYRYAQHRGYDVTGAGDLSAYSDAGEISAYAVSALRWAVADGVVNGMGDGTLLPQGTARRSEAAAMLQRFCEAHAVSGE